MTLRFWLRQNLLKRGLGWLGERAQHRLFSVLLLPSLIPRSPLIRPDTEDPSAGGPVTDARVESGEREVRVLSSEAVRLDTTYAQWIAPLMSLPKGTTTAELMIAAEGLPGYHPEGQYFFPAVDYLDAVGKAGEEAEFAHRCRATQVSWTQSQVVDPAVLLVFSAPVSSSPTRARRSRKLRWSALYSDKFSVFRVNLPNALSGPRLKLSGIRGRFENCWLSKRNVKMK